MTSKSKDLIFWALFIVSLLVPLVHGLITAQPWGVITLTLLAIVGTWTFGTLVLYAWALRALSDGTSGFWRDFMSELWRQQDLQWHTAVTIQWFIPLIIGVGRTCQIADGSQRQTVELYLTPFCTIALVWYGSARRPEKVDGGRGPHYMPS